MQWTMQKYIDSSWVYAHVQYICRLPNTNFPIHGDRVVSISGAHAAVANYHIYRAFSKRYRIANVMLSSGVRPIPTPRLGRGSEASWKHLKASWSKCQPQGHTSGRARLYASTAGHLWMNSIHMEKSHTMNEIQPALTARQASGLPCLA